MTVSREYLASETAEPSPKTTLLRPRAFAICLLAAMCLAVAAFHLPVLLGTRRIPFDFEFYHFPLWKFVFDAFREGSFPVFDRFTYGGVPFLAETQSGLFYPLNGGL